MRGRLSVMPQLRAGRASMVRQYADEAADLQIRQGGRASASDREYPLLLVGLDHEQILVWPAEHIAHQPVPLIDGLFGRAPVPRQGHPARVNQDPSLISLIADDRGKNTECNFIERTNTEPGHEEVEKCEGAGANFGDTVQIPGEESRRRGTDADDGRGKAGILQGTGGAYRGDSLLLGKCLYL